MGKQVTITHVAPSTIEQKREYLIQKIKSIDEAQRGTKADLNAVSTVRFARLQIDDMPEYVRSAKIRIEAFKTARATCTRQLSRINKTIKNKNRYMSGRELE